MKVDELPLELKSIACRLGFVDAGIVLPQRLDHFNDYLSWLSEGHAAGMKYLFTKQALAAREDPRVLMPECKSIIIVMARFPVTTVSDDQGVSSASGRVAAYAGGEDYHVVLGEKLDQLASEITSAINQPMAYRAFTDSAPLLERDLAFSAGLGWIGRNTCLISPEFGSYTFLAELLTDLPLRSECDIIPDRCGTCHRCVDMCPTQCILPNRSIAAERCISYLTIENREDIPYEIRPFLGEWVFGCDICQSVCPWNRKADNSLVDKRFFASEHVRTLELGRELSLSETDFKRIYHASAILRAKYSGYRRNIALAIGNKQHHRSKELLLNIIRDDQDALLRVAAVWAAGQMMDEKVEHVLIDALVEEKDSAVRTEMIQAIESYRKKNGLTLPSEPV
jgi:epoxyqueuosine reductase